jgi:hypothetical protein
LDQFAEQRRHELPRLLVAGHEVRRRTTENGKDDALASVVRLDQEVIDRVLGAGLDTLLTPNSVNSARAERRRGSRLDDVGPTVRNGRKLVAVAMQMPARLGRDDGAR